MRLWSLHPKYLDARGLVALWREALLAQAVLAGRTRGYLRHPQLLRFREHHDPAGAIAEYLRAVHAEATARGYRFAAAKIGHSRAQGKLTVPGGQLQFEWRHLLAKLQKRDPRRYALLAPVAAPAAHPLFRVARGGPAPWEKGAAPPSRRGGRIRRKDDGAMAPARKARPASKTRSRR